MSVNNLDKIKEHLEFRSEDDFYFLQIIQRKKDHGKNVTGSNNNNRLIKPYYVGSIEYLEFVMPEIIQLCEIFNARAGIDLNRRSWKRTSFHALKKMTDQILNEDYMNVRKAFSKAAGKYSNEPEKKWILDYDHEELPYEDYKYLKKELVAIQPIGPKVIDILPSKNGYHIITSPFNLKEAEDLLKKFDIGVHKRNPTNLYIP